MVEIHGGNFTPICDICGDPLEIEDSFDDAVKAMRAAGWKTNKYGDEWENVCTDCQ